MIVLEVQKYLAANNGDFSSLEHLGIKVVHEENHAILKYDQIESPKMHPVVQECRGLVINKITLDVVAKPFSRFFNLGEASEITDKFEWNNPFHAYEKLDGSLAIVWYDWFALKWRFNTSGSFGDSELVLGKSWSEYIASCITRDQLYAMSKFVTYVFEFTSPYNKVVRDYKNTEVVLLSVFDNDSCEEFPAWKVDSVAEFLKFKRPQKFEFKSLEEIKAFIQKQEELDPTFEGLVVQDCNGLRIKIKSSTYVALHQLKGNGNIFLPKNIIPFVLAGETEEVLSYFPEAKEVVDQVSADLEKLWDNLYNSYQEVKDISDQKTFAVKLTVELKDPMASVLFFLKKSNNLNETALKEGFRNAKDLILKIIK
jgi:hypothetical protein